MTKTITATEAVRNFSELLNSIKYSGNDYTIVRGGKPVASLRPAETHSRKLTLGDLVELVKTLPSLGDEADLFRRDVKNTRKHQPRMPEKSTWE